MIVDELAESPLTGCADRRGHLVEVLHHQGDGTDGCHAGTHLGLWRPVIPLDRWFDHAEDLLNEVVEAGDGPEVLG